MRLPRDFTSALVSALVAMTCMGEKLLNSSIDSIATTLAAGSVAHFDSVEPSQAVSAAAAGSGIEDPRIVRGDRTAVREIVEVVVPGAVDRLEGEVAGLARDAAAVQVGNPGAAGSHRDDLDRLGVRVGAAPGNVHAHRLRRAD